MFRTNESFRFDNTAPLHDKDREASYFQLVEVLLDNPIWLVDVTTASSANSTIEWRHKYLAHAAGVALEVLQQKVWRSTALYLLMPKQGGATENRFELRQCKRLWERVELSEASSSWKVDFKSGELFFSPLNRSHSRDDHWRLAWEALDNS